MGYRAGRLHIDDEMMREVEEVKAAVSPQEVILVVGLHERPGRR